MLDVLHPTSLEAARKAAGLSRGELAELSGIHETTIGRIEKGQVDPRVSGTWAPLVRVLKSKSAPDHVASDTNGSAGLSPDDVRQNIGAAA